MPLSRHDALPVVDRVKLAVEIYTAPIQLQVFFKIFDADFVKDSLVEFIIHILRFRSGLRNVKIQPRDEFQTIRRTSEFFQTPFDVRHQTKAFFLGFLLDEVAVQYFRRNGKRVLWGRMWSVRLISVGDRTIKKKTDNKVMNYQIITHE